MAKVLKGAGTQTLGAYIDKRQVTVAEWLELRPILDIFNIETGYEGGGRRRETWWRQTADRKHMRSMLEEILEMASVRRWESGRRGKGEGVREVEESDTGID